VKNIETKYQWFLGKYEHYSKIFCIFVAK
jgi:hypothetical protein